MLDVMPKRVNVFVAKVLSETPIFFVCRLLDLPFALLAVEEAVIANMEPQINVSVIRAIRVIHIRDARTLNQTVVLI